VAARHVDRLDRGAGAGILRDDDLEAWQLASAGLALPLVGDVGHLLQCLDRGYPRHVVLGIVGDGIEAVQVAGLERIAKRVAFGPVERQHVRLVEREAERALGEACSLCLVVALQALPDHGAAIGGINGRMRIMEPRPLSGPRSEPVINEVLKGKG
jgi:hypothetical protein